MNKKEVFQAIWNANNVVECTDYRGTLQAQLEVKVPNNGIYTTEYLYFVYYYDLLNNRSIIHARFKDNDYIFDDTKQVKCIVEAYLPIRDKMERDTKLRVGLGSVFYGLDERCKEIFYKNRITTLDKLLAMRPSDLLKLRNFGRRSLSVVQSALYDRGLRLRKEG